MRYDRRELLLLLIATGAWTAGSQGPAAQPLGKGGLSRMPAEFPSFELQASAEALRQLTAGLNGWRVERIGNSASNVWVQGAEGAIWSISVDQRDVRPMFEVFTLGMLSIAELRERWERWQPPILPEGGPEGLRRLLTTRPLAPAPPSDFETWPFVSWRTEIVRRAEFIVEDVDVGPTFGNNPNAQSAARPGAVPGEASAFCEVAAGIIFTGDGGRRLLMAVDWMPMQMLVTEDPAQIEEFLKDCALLDMETYLHRRTRR